jgi:hypothetical protein
MEQTVALSEVPSLQAGMWKATSRMAEHRIEPVRGTDFEGEIRGLSERLGLRHEPPDMLQEWGRINSDPKRWFEFLQAYRDSSHTDIWVDVEFAELVCSSVDDAMQEGALPPEGWAAVEDWVRRFAHRPGMRHELASWSRLGSEPHPADPYPFGEWLLANWHNITGRPLTELTAYSMFDDPSAFPLACPPKSDPPTMRVSADPGGVQETPGDEEDEAFGGTDRGQAA